MLFYLALAAVVTMLFFTAHYRQTQEPDTRSLQDFYHKTVNAIDRARGGGQTVLDAKTGKEAGRTPIDKDADGDIDADDEILAKEMAERLKAAEQQAKEKANAKAPNKPDAPSQLVGVGSSADGQQKKLDGDAPAKEAAVHKELEVDEDQEAKVILDKILKKSPSESAHYPPSPP
jgi:hypothetical protein